MVRINPLPDWMHEELVGWMPEPIGEKVRIQQAAKLRQFNLEGAKDNSTLVELPLPGIGTYQEVYEKAVELLGAEALINLKKLLNLDLGSIEWGRVPTYPGWIKRPLQGKYGAWEMTKPPSNEVMGFDVENVTTSDDYQDFGSNIKLPVCAIGVSLTHIWVWQWNPTNPTTLIPFGCDNVITGHNIPYDRQFMDIEYRAERSGNIFFDTMAAWVVVHGMGNQQRPAYLAMRGDEYAPSWLDETTTNGLDAVYQFYFKSELDKGVRNEIVQGGKGFVVKHMNQVVTYCFKDVIATLRVFQELYPEYLAFRPNEVTQTAALIMGSYWCPMSAERYPDYFKRVEKIYHETLTEINLSIGSAVGKIIRDYLTDYQDALQDAKDANPKAKKDLLSQWLCDNWLNLLPRQLRCLDWTPVKPKNGSGTIPTWYHKFLKDGFTMSTRETVFVLGTTYRGYAVLWEGDAKTGRFYTEELGDIPNPEKRGERVCQLFTKSCQELVKPDEKGQTVLSAEGELGGLIVKLMSLVNWKSLRKRVWHIHTESPEGYPVFLPLVTVNGTITGRCADRLTQVMPNPKKYRLGTGLKSLFEAPTGYKVLGGDISSQELCIAAWMGDLEAPRMYRGLDRPFLGSCPLSVAVMTGTSATKTDVHSVMAQEQNLERDIVKSEVYGAIYGQGVSGCTNYLMAACPTWSEQQCKQSATTFTTKFVGRREGYTFSGGLASETFNRLNYIIATQPRMETPVFRCTASTSLTANKKEYKTTKINRLVQASGADWRDSLVLLTEYFYLVYGVDGRIMLTIHDEIRTIVKDEHIPQASYCLMLAHVYTVSAFIDILGLDLIPASKAWFEELDATQHLSKAWNKAGECPEYPEGLPTGIGITAQTVLEYIQSGLVKVNP